MHCFLFVVSGCFVGKEVNISGNQSQGGNMYYMLREKGRATLLGSFHLHSPCSTETIQAA